MITASEASARWTSASVMPPTVAWRILICTSGCCSLPSSLRMASIEPRTSARRMMFSVCTSSCWPSRSKRVSRVTCSRPPLSSLLAAGRGPIARPAARACGDVVQDVEAVAGAGGHAQPGHVDRRRGAGLLVPLVGVERVVHRLDAAVGRCRRRPRRPPRSVPVCTRNLAITPRSSCISDSRQVPRAGRSGSARYSCNSATVSSVSSSSSMPSPVVALVLTNSVSPPHWLGKQLVGGQLLVDAVDVDARQVDLVQRHDDGHAGGPGVADGLFGLRHDAVVGGHHQHGDVGDVGPAGPHLGEGLVARRIDEGDRPGRPSRRGRRGCAG